jgi:hypothetical protein
MADRTSGNDVNRALKGMVLKEEPAAQSPRPESDILPAYKSTGSAQSTSSTSSETPQSIIERRILNPDARNFWLNFWGPKTFEVTLTDFMQCLEEYTGIEPSRDSLLAAGVSPVDGRIGTAALNQLMGKYDTVMEALQTLPVMPASSPAASLRQREPIGGDSSQTRIFGGPGPLFNNGNIVNFPPGFPFSSQAASPMPSVPSFPVAPQMPSPMMMPSPPPPPEGLPPYDPMPTVSNRPKSSVGLVWKMKK